MCNTAVQHLLMDLDSGSEDNCGPTPDEVNRFMQRGQLVKDGSISLVDSRGYNLKVGGTMLLQSESAP